MRVPAAALLAALLVLAGCASVPPAPVSTAPAPSAEPEVAAVPPSATPGGNPQAVLTALGFIDAPYLRGGVSPTGFDCSGFTRHVFEVAQGLRLPRRAQDQAQAAGLPEVGRDALQPGDLVFFNTLRRPYSHVGIYLGRHRFVHAPRIGARVRIEDLRVHYWASRFDGARRVPPAAEGAGLALAPAH
jgi:cell wall-associated NlpC family hydrolase